MTTARAARLPGASRAAGSTTLERLRSLEVRQDASEESADKQGEQLARIEHNVQRILNIFERVTGIKMLLIALGSFVTVTAATVTATIAVIRYFTGH